MCVLVLLLFIQNSSAQILAWSFSSPDAQGTEESIEANFRDPKLKPSKLVRGPAMLNTNSLSRAFMSKLKLAGSLSNTKEKAFSEGAYFQFKITPEQGHMAFVSSISAKLRPGAGGRPYYYRWAYSLDGKRFKELGNQDGKISYDYSKRDGEEIPVLNLSKVSDFQKIKNNKEVTVRLYVWGAVNPETSTFAIGRSEPNNNSSFGLTVNGEVK